MEPIGLVYGAWRVVELSHSIRCTSGTRRVWKTVCTNCGMVRLKTTDKLGRLLTCKSCRMMPKGEAGLNELFLRYKIGSSRNGRNFSITIGQFRAITSRDCHYCGRKPASVCICNKYNPARKTDWGGYIYNGIDRKNNTVGYTILNCISCCYICNRAKSSMAYDEFIAYVSALSEHRVKM